MFYSFAYTPTASDTATDPYKMPLKLSSGVIHQVDVLFQDGCNHEEFVQVWQANYQVWPLNRGASLRGNATVVSFRDFYELTPGLSTLDAYIWSTLSSGWKEIIIQIGLLPKRVLQPLSFDELLAAATGVQAD